MRGPRLCSVQQPEFRIYRTTVHHHRRQILRQESTVELSFQQQHQLDRQTAHRPDPQADRRRTMGHDERRFLCQSHRI